MPGSEVVMDHEPHDDLTDLDALWKRLGDGVQVRVDDGEVVVYGPLARMEPDEVARALNNAGDNIRWLIAHVRESRRAR